MHLCIHDEKDKPIAHVFKHIFEFIKGAIVPTEQGEEPSSVVQQPECDHDHGSKEEAVEEKKDEQETEVKSEKKEAKESPDAN